MLQSTVVVRLAQCDWNRLALACGIARNNWNADRLRRSASSGDLQANQYTGEVLGERTRGQTFLGFVREPYVRLAIGVFGKHIVKWSAIVMLVSGHASKRDMIRFLFAEPEAQAGLPNRC
jgi:hypothetical protein